MKGRFFLLLVLCGLFGACIHHPSESRNLSKDTKQYWANFDFSDSTQVDNYEVVEARFATYITLLEDPQLTPPVAGELLQKTLHQAGANDAIFNLFWELCEKYLYSPESPVRDEELYIYALQSLIASNHVDGYHKLRPRYQLNMALQNRLGHPATEFTYTEADGHQSTLYSLAADYTILFFNNPDCEACEQLRAQLQRSPLIRILEKLGRLRVLALYSNTEEDQTRWQATVDSYPTSWIMAYDAGAQLHYKGLYDLRGIPCLYLLDRHKRVLYKGATTTTAITAALRKDLF
ncbi:MAG: DUF5106 domain-containing protein [Alistipes sp.]